MARTKPEVIEDVPVPPFFQQAISQMGRFGSGGLSAPPDQRGAGPVQIDDIVSGVLNFTGNLPVIGMDWQERERQRRAEEIEQATRGGRRVLTLGGFTKNGRVPALPNAPEVERGHFQPVIDSRRRGGVQAPDLLGSELDRIAEVQRNAAQIRENELAALTAAGTFLSTRGITGRTVQQEIAARAQAEALKRAGLSADEAAKTMNAPRAADVKGLNTATGAKAAPSLWTRSLQTAFGTAEGGGMPDVLKPYAPGGAAFTGNAKKHGGVIGAATRAVMAGDEDIVSRLTPEFAQQIRQSKIAQLAREANASEDTIRQALQIMDHAVQGVDQQAMSALASAVKAGKALPDDTSQLVFAAEHAALTKAGLPVTDVTQALMRAQLVSRVKAAEKAAAKAGDATEALLTELRKSGMDDASIARGLQGMGISADEAAKTVFKYGGEPYPSGVVPGVGPTIQRVRGSSTPLPEPYTGQPYPSGVEPRPGRVGARERRDEFAKQHVNESYSVPGGLFNEAARMVDDVTPPPPSAPPRTPPGPPEPPLPQRAAAAFANTIGDLLDVWKTGRAILDVSQLGRQGLVPVVAAALSRDAKRRVIARDAFVNAIRGYGDRFAGEVWEGVMKDPLYQIWKKQGGAERVIPSSRLEHLQSATTRSELHSSKILENTPGLRHAVRASERSFSLTLDALAFYSWKQGYLAIKAGGRLPTDAEQKALANWYNVVTGTGQIGQGKWLNRIFWAPRFVASRFQAPYYMVKYLADPATREVGKLAAKDLGKTVAAGIGFLKMAELAGFKVNWDPRSSDFGKIRLPNDTTIDIWGGYQQPTVFIARIVTDYYINSAGKGSKLSDGGHFGTSIEDLVARFFKSKLNPNVGMLLAFAQGKDFAGEPFGPRGGQTSSETIEKMLRDGEVFPLSWVDAIHATIEDLEKGTSVERGLPPGTLGAAAGVAGLAGAGVQTYERPVARDGLGRDLNGPVPPHPVLDTWTMVRALSSKSPRGSPTFPDLVPPDDTVGTTLLTRQEHDRLAVLTGQNREAILQQIVTSSQFATKGQEDKEKALLGARNLADRMAREQFGLELATTAIDDGSRVRAVNIALVGAGKAEKMDALGKFAAQGALTQEVKTAIDSQRKVTDPADKGYELSVDEHLRGNELVARYLAFPAFRYGDQRTWAEAARQITVFKAARSAMERLAVSRGVQIQQLDAYKKYISDYQNTQVAGFQINRFIDIEANVRDAAVSPQRLAIEQDPMWRHFRDIARQRDPYGVRSP